jgi:hypothetical protein
LAAAGFTSAIFFAPAVATAQSKKRNPTSKVYVSDVAGEALIDTGDAVEDVSKRSVYYAQGAVIETRKPENADAAAKNYSTMVYSNGTGAFFDADTRVEVKKFVQEPFTPNRTDIELEPSVSQTQAFVSRGAVGLCTSKLVAGSSMTYATPHGMVNVRGRKLVVETKNDVTKISMIEGDSTVRGGPEDLGGYTVKAGEQAIIRPNPAGGASLVEITRIPPAELPQLDEKVTMACMAKRTVYFEERERPTGSERNAASDNSPTGGNGETGETDSPGAVTAFDGSSGTSSVTTREIVPVEVVPVNLPVEFTVSPATLTNPARTVNPPGLGNGNGPPGT